MEPVGRVPVLSPATRLLLGASLAACAALAPGDGARAATFLTQGQALAEAFPGARLERRALALTPQQAKAVETRARSKLPSRLITAHLAWRGDTLAGVGFVDQRVVRTMPAVLLVVVAPDSTVRKVEVLAFHEPPDYLPVARWRERFAGERLDDRLWPGRDVRPVAGATLTARSVTEAVRTALAAWEVLLAPTLARPTAAAH